MVNSGDSRLTEERVKEIAASFIQNSGIDPCTFESIRRVSKSEIRGPDAMGYVWFARFAFELPTGVTTSTASHVTIKVDDLTGEAQLLESL